MAIAVIVVAAGWFVMQSPLFDVDSVLVEGNVHTTTDDILASSGLETGKPLVSVRSAAVRRRLADLPWVADVRVDVAWSGEVRLQISEREPVAVVIAPDGREVLVDATGRVLAASNTDEVFQAGLTRIEGVEIVGSADGSPDRVVGADGALELVGLFGPGVASRVDVVEASRNGLTATLRPQGTVLFGSATDLEAKVRSLTTVLAGVSLEDLDTIDVRVPDQPVVTRVATPSWGDQNTDALGWRND